MSHRDVLITERTSKKLLALFKPGSNTGTPKVGVVDVSEIESLFLILVGFVTPESDLTFHAHVIRFLAEPETDSQFTSSMKLNYRLA
ncbi:MAG: hypothetical protein WCR86_13560 [Parabacteroides sp.]